MKRRAAASARAAQLSSAFVSSLGIGVDANGNATVTAPGGGSTIEFYIAYEFRSRTLGLLMGAISMNLPAIFMPAGPMLRGMEIASAVADSSKTAVLQQVTNGVHMRMAVLFRLLVGSEDGAL